MISTKSYNFLQYSKGVLCIVLAACLIVTTQEVIKFNTHLSEEVTRVRIDTGNQVTATRHDLLSKVDDIRGDFRFFTNTTDRRISSIEGKLFTEVAAIRTDTLSRVDSIHNDVLPVRDSVVTLAKTYNDLPAVVGDRLDPYTDCKKNALCWQSQFSDTLFAVRTSSRAVGESAGVVSTNITLLSNNFAVASGTFTRDFPVITSNLSATAQNINNMTKPKWYDRIITYGATGSLLYFNLVGGKALAKAN